MDFSKEELRFLHCFIGGFDEYFKLLNLLLVKKVR